MKKEEAIEAAPISTAQVAPEAERADAAAAGTATAAKAVVKRKAKRAGKRERLGSRCPDDDAAWTPSTANSRLQRKRGREGRREVGRREREVPAFRRTVGKLGTWLGLTSAFRDNFSSRNGSCRVVRRASLHQFLRCVG